MAAVTRSADAAARTSAPRAVPLVPPYPADPIQRESTASRFQVDSVRSTALSHPHAHHHQVALAADSQPLRLEVVVFDSRHFRLAVIDQPDPQAGSRVISELMRRHGAVAGVNGGFFSPEFQPIGLSVMDGRPLSVFTRSSLISGLVMQGKDGPSLLWNAEYPGRTQATAALQAGPRLLDGGRPVAGLDTSKRRTRSFIATDGGHLWAIGTADSCSLGELAAALATPGTLPGLSPQRALNLDGGRSTAFWFAQTDGRETSRPGWSTVRNYLAVIPR